MTASTDAVIAGLKQRGLHEVAEQVAASFQIPLEQILSQPLCHQPEVVDARYALLVRLRMLLPSNSAVARVIGLSRFTVSLAVTEARELAEVELARFELADPAPSEPLAYVLRWRGRSQGPAFGITTICATAGNPPGAWERETEWFQGNAEDWKAKYHEAYGRFSQLCRASLHGKHPSNALEPEPSPPFVPPDPSAPAPEVRP
jgi:hypothetical protein